MAVIKKEYRVKEYTGANNQNGIQSFLNNTADRDWIFVQWIQNGAKEFGVFVKDETDLL
jgi:hypothetical protein